MRNAILVVLFLLFLTACAPVDTPTLAATNPPAPTAASVQPTATLSPEPLPPANTAAQQSTAEILFEQPYRLGWTADGTALMVASNERISLFDAAILTELNTVFPEPGEVIHSISALSGLAVFGRDQYLRLVDLRDGSNRTELNMPAPPYNASLSPDGRFLLVGSNESITVDVWDLTTNENLATLSGFETAAPVYMASFSPGGQSILWMARGTIQVMDFPSGELHPAIHHQDFIMAHDLTLDGTRLATAAGGTNEAGEFAPFIYLWNPATGEETGRIPVEPSFTALAFSPDGSLLAAGAGPDLIIFDAASLEEVNRLSAANLTALAFSPAGTRLAGSSSEGWVRIWPVPQP